MLNSLSRLLFLSPNRVPAVLTPYSLSLLSTPPTINFPILTDEYPSSHSTGTFLHYSSRFYSTASLTLDEGDSRARKRGKLTRSQKKKQMARSQRRTAYKAQKQAKKRKIKAKTSDIPESQVNQHLAGTSQQQTAAPETVPEPVEIDPLDIRVKFQENYLHVQAKPTQIKEAQGLSKKISLESYPNFWNEYRPSAIIADAVRIMGSLTSHQLWAITKSSIIFYHSLLANRFRSRKHQKDLVKNLVARNILRVHSFDSKVLPNQDPIFNSVTNPSKAYTYSYNWAYHNQDTQAKRNRTSPKDMKHYRDNSSYVPFGWQRINRTVSLALKNPNDPVLQEQSEAEFSEWKSLISQHGVVDHQQVRHIIRYPSGVGILSAKPFEPYQPNKS